MYINWWNILKKLSGKCAMKKKPSILSYEGGLKSFRPQHVDGSTRQ